MAHIEVPHGRHSRDASMAPQEIRFVVFVLSVVKRYVCDRRAGLLNHEEREGHEGDGGLRYASPTLWLLVEAGADNDAGDRAG